MKRCFRLTTATILYLVLLSLGLAEDWPQFLGPRRNGSCLESNIAPSWNADGPRKLWERKIGAGFSGPIVKGTNLFLFHRLGEAEMLECLAAEKGTLIWSNSSPTHYRDDFGFDEGPRATPAASDESIYTFGAEGMLTCWRLSDGKKQWAVDGRKQFGAEKGFFGIACSPLIERDLVLLNMGGFSGAGIVAFDAQSGKVKWKATDQPASYSSPVVADVKGKRLAFFLTREGLVVLTPSDGRMVTEFSWRPPMNASVSAATPLVIDHYIFLSTSYDKGAVLLDFDGQKVKEVWSGDDQLSNHYATSVYHDGYLYGFHGRQEQGCDLRCVDFKTGKVKWSEERFGAGTITQVNRELFILRENGELVRAPATPSGFKASARAQVLPFQVRAYPAFAQGRMFARSKDRLVCVDLRP
jgi:outer membrane protein assembly factor BamB